MSSSEILPPRSLLPPFWPTLGTHSPAHHVAESRHVTDMAVVFTVCLCTPNSGLTTNAKRCNRTARRGGCGHRRRLRDQVGHGKVTSLQMWPLKLTVSWWIHAPSWHKRQFAA